ncbi:hypothetical protein LXM94_03720 [Rhizobium sp. TRM95111]|uniref:hypothetical protein n=1 Tax=Rhizobium alarense TaxID=2846851 RepID=UPI001F15FB37|nr:hypothetical protein [Rhizobium alarense]MCF3639067.1 hypothetical protein [Rhizobium alarense]
MLPEQDKPAGTIIHVGAGRAENVEALNASDASRVVLIEPNPDIVVLLQRRTKAMPKIVVMPLALAATDGVATLEILTASALSSLKPPTKLKALLPGLETVSRQEVQTLSPRSLLARLGEIQRPLRLALEAPGVEMEILKAWKAADSLHLIDQVDLRCGEEALYDGAATRAQLEAWLTNEKFRLLATDRNDPDWPVLHFEARHDARALAETVTKLEAAAKRIIEIESSYAKLAEAHDHLALELRATQGDLALALRTQGILQGDLTDLRQRYKKLLDIKQLQDHAFHRLAPNLRELLQKLKKSPEKNNNNEPLKQETSPQKEL